MWDAAVRLLHWLLAALVLFDYFIDDEGGLLHRTIGYVAVGVVFSRLLWSGLGEGANGFAPLRPSLQRTLAYFRGGAPRTLAHDPFGLWMVWLLWSLVLLLGLTGWMTRLDAFWGDETLHDVHAWLAHALIAAVAAAPRRRRGHELALAREPGAGDDHRTKARGRRRASAARRIRYSLEGSTRR